MNILVTGANGQLAKCLKKIVESHGNGQPNSVVGEKDYWIFADKATLDITKLDDVGNFIKNHFINVVVNCAAYTNVKKAEESYDAPYAVNAAGAECLAWACKLNGAVLIHISTDYVFDGTKGAPYEPSDERNPLNSYGTSKSDGEKLIEQQGGKYLIFRTSWLYSQYGYNFVKTIFSQWNEGKNTRVVYDQIGSPTNANNLARFIYRIITDNNCENRYLSKTGIYHYCDAGVASWYDLAQAVYDYLGTYEDKDYVCVTPNRTAENTNVKRPSVSVLDTALTQAEFDEVFINWRHSLKEVIDILEHEKES